MVTCSDNMHDIGGRTVTCQCQNTMLVIMWFCDLKKTVINNHQWRKLDCHYASIRIQPRQYSTVQTYPYFCWLDNTLRGMSLIQKKILVFFNIGILYWYSILVFFKTYFLGSANSFLTFWLVMAKWNQRMEFGCQQAVNLKLIGQKFCSLF